MVVVCRFQEDMQTERLSECCGAGSTCMRVCAHALCALQTVVPSLSTASFCASCNVCANVICSRQREMRDEGTGLHLHYNRVMKCECIWPREARTRQEPTSPQTRAHTKPKRPLAGLKVEKVHSESLQLSMGHNSEASTVHGVCCLSFKVLVRTETPSSPRFAEL